MFGILKSFKNTKEQDNLKRRADAYRSLIRKESEMGGSLFGPLSGDNRREFFCLDEHTWIWHEEWTDIDGNRKVVTTRYDIRPSGVVKSQGGKGYQSLSPKEAKHLKHAINLYNKRVQKLYAQANS